MELTVPFIDTSEHQGDIDFGVCAANGVPHAIPRAGINGRADLKYDRSVQGYRDAGIGVPAAYWFINPKSSYGPTEQASIMCDLLGKYRITTGMLDCEWYANERGPNPVLSAGAYNDWVWRFIGVLQNARIRPIVYTSAAFWNGVNAAPDADIGVFDTIIASYKWQQGSTGNDPIAQGVPPAQWGAVVLSKSQPPLPAGWDGSLEGWQFSAGGNKQGRVYGMQSTDLDLNVGNLEAIDKWYGNPLSPSEVDMEEDMLAFMHNSNGWVKAVDDDGYARNITGQEFYGMRKKTLADSYLMAPGSDEELFNSWPTRPAPGGAATVTIDYAEMAKAIFDEQARRLAG